MDWLDNLSKTASNVGAAVNTFRAPTVPASAAPTNAQPAAKPTNWLVIGGIGAALLVVLFFVFKK